MKKTNFVILTTSRTGSSWLVDLLNKQQDVAVYGELFLDRVRSRPAMVGLDDYPRFVEWRSGTLPGPFTPVTRYLDGLYRRSGSVGFKLMYTHLRHHPMILGYFVRHRVRVVHLTRQNYLDAIISEELARATGRSHAAVGHEADLPQVYLDPETLLSRLRARERSTRQVQLLTRLSTCRVAEVSYESLLTKESEFARICRFLRIDEPSVQVSSSLQKRGTRPHREAISNYRDVQRALGSTRYSSLLD